MRAIGLGSCSMMARIGAIVTPFVAQVQTIVVGIHAVLPVIVLSF